MSVCLAGTFLIIRGKQSGKIHARLCYPNEVSLQSNKLTKMHFPKILIKLD
jgi:hypothetical protein